MGQKIHPTGFRLAVTRNWSSRWFADDKAFGAMLAEDIRVREYLKKLKSASVGRVIIERPPRMPASPSTRLVRAWLSASVAKTSKA